MKQLFVIILVLLLAAEIATAQSAAQRRAGRMGVGMNLSYLDNWWLGTKDKRFADFVKPADASKRQKMFAEIAKAGFRTVRIPINFGAWASVKAPYKWENPESLKTVDLFVKWAADNDLNAIVDLHHVEFDGTVEGAATTERIVWLWKEIAARYKNTNPEKVFFELRNEPHDVKAEDWHRQAEEIIKAVRAIAPNHTLIVGFHDWNSRQAMIDSKPFADGNIIYTFHYYDPFVFTHQGATWSAKGLPELTSVPFPAKDSEISVPETAKSTWVESQIKSYGTDSRAGKMFADLKAAKDWSVKNDVPIFLGEFGSFGKYPSIEDRCRHAQVVYSALGKLNIPNAWWEWDGGFNMFEKGTTQIAGCMRKAVDSYSSR
jgi:endoglucanase